LQRTELVPQIEILRYIHFFFDRFKQEEVGRDILGLADELIEMVMNPGETTPRYVLTVAVLAAMYT
jgi:hypothetical protein